MAHHPIGREARLTRDDASKDADALSNAGGQPALSTGSIYAELDVRVTGIPDQRSGYLLSISEIDRAVREALPEALPRAFPRSDAAMEPAAEWPHRLLRELAAGISRRIGRAPSSLELRLTPYHAVSLEIRDMPEALITRRFDFCAAHRLHLPELSDAENLALFGKCSHPSGHGHNYRLEVTVAAAVVGIERWSEIVRHEVVDRYDHRNLNIDCPEFRTLNPSVENIARVCHERLERPLRDAGVSLRRVRVFESEKTWCEFP